LAAREAEREKEEKDSISAVHKAGVATMQAEQEKELAKLMNKDSISTTEKTDLAAREAEREKTEKDSIAAALKADLTAMQVEQEKELAKLMKKDSIEAAEKADLAAKQAVREKTEKDSIATATKKEESVNNPFNNPYKKEEGQENKDSVIVTKKENPEQKEKSPKLLPLPERFKIYDADNDGILSYNEILSAIDAFLDKAPDTKEDPKMVKFISEMIDFFFDQ
jgi:hypothetical protein